MTSADMFIVSQGKYLDSYTCLKAQYLAWVLFVCTLLGYKVGCLFTFITLFQKELKTLYNKQRNTREKNN